MVAPAPLGEKLSDLLPSATSIPRSGLDDLLGALLANRPAWHRDALCQEHPEVSFFPAQHEDPGPAKALCAQCLVMPECNRWALEQDASLAGIWAGTGSVQRRRMRAARAA